VDRSFLPLALTVFASVCLPVMAVSAAGWGLDRWLRLDLRTLVKLNIRLFIPAFLFVRLVESDLDLAAGLKVVLFTLVMLATLALTGWAVARLFRWPTADRKAFQMATMFYNCGNFGIPVMALAFPGSGPVIQSFVLMTMNLSTFTAGVLLAHGDEAPRSRWLTVLQQPSLAVIALAWTCKGLGLAPALQGIDALWVPLEFVAQGLVPLALVTLGVQLSQTRVLPLQGPLLAAVATRLVGGPVLAALVVPWFGFSPEISAILITGTAAPTAVNAALLVHEYGDGRSGSVPAAVFYSTIFSAMTVTLVLALLKAAS